ncbi:PREDICTED: uncharacterized protein LOC108374374 [Rhagoletis zephyria]|uniref:uncharacterized protein LOC108374374 n=1 Tax=Rhagoletis zephyria TaxID=28612 RepID=UPI000811458D|nr:PREDICTED: uncharacterized protein LOC108374374 [Rhagoletis zephyria]XP_036320409.1 uncharacterized protein LOC118734837 [Rhagoletis pomonella]
MDSGLSHNSTLADNSVIVATPKLPKLKLPSFSGKNSEYKNFIASFSQIIDRKQGLSNIEKFNHLLNCLKGQALETVQAFPVTNENYRKALERLKLRYYNDSLIFLENINMLFDMQPLSYPNATQLRSIVDKVSALFGSLSSLGTDKEIANAMLIHLVITKIDEESRKKMERVS